MPFEKELIEQIDEYARRFKSFREQVLNGLKKLEEKNEEQ